MFNINLVTGAIGTGKTTYVVDQLIAVDLANKKFIEKGELESVKKIYSNISGLKIEHEPLPDDWRTTPNNSVIAIDECHKIDIYQPTRKALHDDPRIIALNEARHTGHVFYFITQAPKFLHQHIRGITNKHFHFHRPMGAKAACVFMWSHGNTLNPDSENQKSKAENTFIYGYSKEAQKNFDSIDEGANHTTKLKIPRKVIFWCSLPIILICFMVYLLTKPQTLGNLTGETFTNAGSEIQNLNKTVSSSTSPAVHSSSDLSVECRKGVNVEKPECVKYFDDLTKNGSSVNSENVQVSYNINDPYGSSDEIQNNITYQVTAKPVFSGCLKTNGSYVAYTQQGTKIHNIDKAACEKLIQNNDRPFNYFAEKQPEQRERSAPEQPQLNPETSSL